MVIVVKKSKVLMISIVFLISMLLYSVNLLKDFSMVSVVSGNLTQKTVIIDAGHGGEDPGAVSDYSGIKEKDINLNIALKLRELLQKENYKIIMTREEDKLVYSPETTNIVQKRKQDLLRRKNIMDEGGAQVVVSIHLNKFPQTQYFGAQTFYSSVHPESQKLAFNIQKSLRELVDKGNSREALAKKEPIIILKNVKTTTAIVECGFLSNQEEEKKLATKEYQDSLAQGIKEGIKAYFAK